MGPGPATREAYERLVQTEALSAVAPLLSSRLVPLVGREREWMQLQKSWRIAAAGALHRVRLAGEAGIGMTRFEELAGLGGAAGYRHGQRPVLCRRG